MVSAPGRGAPAARADLKVELETACWGLQRCRAQALDCDGQTAKRAGPSTARVSKSGGEAVLPVTATRSGVKRSPALTPRSSANRSQDEGHRSQDEVVVATRRLP